MRKYGICLLLGLCLLLTACGAGQETPDGDAVPAAYWTGGDADLPRLRAEMVHCSEAGFYLEDGGADRSPLVTETFSGTLPDGEQELTVDFLWCVFRGEVYVRQPEDARVVVEPIRGCTTAVTVLVPGQDRMEHGRYALARLGENTLEWLFPGRLQGLELRQLELTPDLTRAVFLARVEDGDGFYEAPYLCDGQQLVDLARSCGGETPRGAVGVRWDGDDILLFLSDSWTRDTEARTDVYLYHGGRWEQTVCDAPLYVQARQEDGIQFHYGSRYATRLMDGRLCVVDLRSGAVEDTGIPAQAEYTVYQQDGQLVILTQPG